MTSLTGAFSLRTQIGAIRYNRGGDDGAIAGNAVKTAAPDGYTLLFATTNGLNAAPIMRKQPS